jgi:hypothetical protein
MRAVRAWIAAAVLIASAPALALADNRLLAEAIAKYDDLEYDEAIRRLSAALLVPGNTPEDNATIYRYLGLSYLLLDRPEPATGAFRNLLVLRADYRFDAETAPRIVEFFEQVRRQWEADGRPGIQELPPPPLRPVRILHVVPETAERGTALRIQSRIEDPDNQARGMFLNYRTGSRGAFQRSPVPAGPAQVSTIPASAVQPPTVEYFLEVVDEGGRAVATRGDTEAPLRVVVPGPGGSILGKWWFWTGAVALIGGAVVLGVVLSSDDGGPGPGPDDVTVRIRVVEAPE